MRHLIARFLLLAALAVTLLAPPTSEAATARTDASARITARMLSTSGWFRDSPVLEAQLRIVLDNTDAASVARMTGTLAGSGTANIDTRGGLTLIDGSTSASIASIKLIAIRVSNPAANQTLKMGVGASNGVTTLVDNASSALVVGGGIAGGYGGWSLLYNPAGWATTAGTGDIIVLTNSGSASLDYELVLVGT